MKNILFLLVSVSMAPQLMAEEVLDTEQYAELQKCMSVAIDVDDDGSYQQFCINRYLDGRK